jgi:predicted ester cyclase
MDTFGNQTSFLANDERHEGREAVRAFSGECFRAFPNLQFATTPLHVGEEAIPVELGPSGTHTGTWFGIPPTGRRCETPVCAVFIFDAHDTMAGERGSFDWALMRRQLGPLPPS